MVYYFKRHEYLLVSNETSSFFESLLRLESMGRQQKQEKQTPTLNSTSFLLPPVAAYSLLQLSNWSLSLSNPMCTLMAAPFLTVPFM